MSPNPDDVAAAIAFLQTQEQTPLSIDAIIANARQKLLGRRMETTEGDQIESPDADYVNELLALGAQMKAQADRALAEREKITATLAEYTKELRFGVEDIPAGGKVELTVHGAPVFIVDSRKSRVFNAAHAKKVHPDIPGNEDFWEDKFTVFRSYK